MTVLVTGATGFVGKALILDLLSKAFEVKALVRQWSVAVPLAVEQIVVGDFADLALDDSYSFLTKAFNGVQVVVHTAALAHVMGDDVSNQLAEFRKINCDASLILARWAAGSDVRRFIFLSSIAVNGNNNQKPFTENDSPNPHNSYALSKYETEQGLSALAKETGMEVVIIRPPLVYGANAPGNFGSLVKWMNRPVPLPFAAIHNQRSLVALDNVVNFISLCSDREISSNAANQVFLISDGEDVSTTQLLRKVGQALNHHSPSSLKAWLVPFPVSIMMFFAKILGRRNMANGLFGSLQIDSSKARDLLGWEPVVSMDEQLRIMVKVNEKNL